MYKFLIFFLVLSGCTPKPPNVFVFENLQQRLAIDPETRHLILTPSPVCMKEIGEPECGHGVKIVSGEQIFIGEKPPHLLNKKTWSEIKYQSVYVPAEESYAPLSAYLINSCKKMNCNDQLEAFKVKLNSLRAIGDVMSPEVRLKDIGTEGE